MATGKLKTAIFFPHGIVTTQEKFKERSKQCTDINLPRRSPRIRIWHLLLLGNIIYIDAPTPLDEAGESPPLLCLLSFSIESKPISFFHLASSPLWTLLAQMGIMVWLLMHRNFEKKHGHFFKTSRVVSCSYGNCNCVVNVHSPLWSLQYRLRYKQRSSPDASLGKLINILLVHGCLVEYDHVIKSADLKEVNLFVLKICGLYVLLPCSGRLLRDNKKTKEEKKNAVKPLKPSTRRLPAR